MKALFLTAPRQFEFRETETRQAPDGWARVRVRHVGICGSDIHYFETGRIGDQVVRYPFILGHEGSGEILEGAGRHACGLPVYIEPAMPCHRCDQCLTGRENTCRELKFLGNPLESAGCMSEEIVMPADCLVPIPGWMGLHEAVLLEPLSIGVYAVARARTPERASAAIVGAGPIGLSVLLALGELNPRQVLVSEPVAERRRAAGELGAAGVFDPGPSGSAARAVDASGGGVDVAFECCGSQDSIDDAALMLRPGGTLVLIGIPAGQDRITYDPHLARRREITAVHVRRQNGCVERALAILERRRDAPKVLITHRFSPGVAREGFELVQRRADGVIKALVGF
jgi:L-iditol 2-dehydrogenase